MGLIDGIRNLLSLEPMQQMRADEDLVPLDLQIAAIQQSLARPWRAPSIDEALGVPSVFRAITLISNTISMLSMEAIRNGVPMRQEDAPRIVVRPNPFTIPREFHRDTVWDMATRGEAWWWIAARDVDGIPLSLYPMPAREVTVETNERDLMRPIIKWRERQMANEDVRQIIFARRPGDLRGVGPLQLCGAAVSVAVESQSWAANFFAEGGVPSVLIKSAVNLSEDDAANLKTQWAETPSNVPRVIDPDIEDVKDFSLDPEKAQLTETRRFAKGDVSDMFSIPGPLVNYIESGSSLTYQNIADVYDLLLKTCLLPNYIEPIEQTMSDLLTRTTVARFKTSSLLRADVKTRYEVYEKGIASGVMTVEEARVEEGFAPGDIERAPVPAANPASMPTVLPIQQRSAGPVRCDSCRRLLAEMATPPYRFTCPKCKAINAADAVETRGDDRPVNLTFADGAFQVNVAPAPAPSVVFETGSIAAHFEAPAPAQTVIQEGAVRVEAPRPPMKLVMTRDEEGRISGYEESEASA